MANKTNGLEKAYEILRIIIASATLIGLLYGATHFIESNAQNIKDELTLYTNNKIKESNKHLKEVVDLKFDYISKTLDEIKRQIEEQKNVANRSKN